MALLSRTSAPVADPGDLSSRAGSAGGVPAVAGLSRRPIRPAAVLPLTDAAALTAALAAASIVAGWPGWLAVGYPATALVALWVSGLHRLRICMRVSDQVGRILATVTGSALVLLPWTSAATVLRLILWSAGLLLAFRVAGALALRAAHRRGYLTEPVLLVGAGPTGEQILGLLAEHPELGLRPCGFIDASPLATEPGMPVVGGPAELAELVARGGVRRIIVCSADERGDEFASVLRDCRDLRADICVVPRLRGLGMAVPGACLDEIWGVPLVPLRHHRAATSRSLKRAFDVVAAAILLAAAAPLLGAMALVIKVRRRHPVFFRQVRVVGCGRLAEIIKLRTMGVHPDADTCWVVPPWQVTPLGRWLRATHLDELPQLINVLRGDMSLVGPRPERPYFAEKFGREIPRYDDRHRMRAGLTGLAQVHGLHGDTSIHERVRFDNLYIDNWSLWLDVLILARTLTTVARVGRTRKTSVTA